MLTRLNLQLSFYMVRMKLGIRKPTIRNLNSGEEKSIEIKELVNEIKII